MGLLRDPYTMSAEDVKKHFGTDSGGLSRKEAERRLNSYGSNIIQRRGTPPFLSIFAGQFKDPMVLLLLASTLVAAFMGEMVDAYVILLIVFLNAGLGSVQEFKAEKSLEALENYAPPKALVIREGEEISLPRESLVPGDIIKLAPGLRVPADGRLISSNSLQCEEAALTGESAPRGKHHDLRLSPNALLAERKNMVFAGTMVVRGEGLAVVVSTGMRTEMGRIARLVQSATQEETPLQRRLSSLGKALIALCPALCAVLVLVGILRGEPLHKMILMGVSLTVAAVPEGLPAVVTLCFAFGVQRMARRNCIVRKLDAIETLGAVTVICTDKTGTLTENLMRVHSLGLPRRIERGNGASKEGEEAKRLILAALLASDARNASFSDNAGEDPTEQAIVKEALYMGIPVGRVDGLYKRIAEKPFTSVRRMMSVLVKEGSRTILYAKGAPDTLLQLCKDEMPGSPLDKEGWWRWVENEASLGRRILAVASKEILKGAPDYKEEGFTLLGCLALEDPLRMDAKNAVTICQEAGIKPVLITGDHLKTAESIGRSCGILPEGATGITGNELDSLSIAETAKIADRHPVLARVSPLQKLKVVRAFKRSGEIVAMTGDGVNDAPALKEAAVGVAMGRIGTDVAKEASSVVILDDDFKTIVAAVEEGRSIYDNIRKFIRYLFSCNLGEVITVSIAMAAGFPMPLTPTQLLWMNLVTDGLPALALSMDGVDEEVMKRPPRDPREGILSGGLLKLIFSRGFYIGAITFIIYLSRIQSGDFLKASTLAYASLVTCQLVTAFDCRSEDRTVKPQKMFGNLYLVGACVLSWFMLYATIHIPFISGLFKTTPLGLSEWILVFFAAIFPDVVKEAYLGKKRT